MRVRADKEELIKFVDDEIEKHLKLQKAVPFYRPDRKIYYEGLLIGLAIIGIKLKRS